jgi:hypothetical protein
VLLLAVTLDSGRMLLAIMTPVLAIPGAPLLGAIQASLLVFRVRKFLPVIIGAPPPLTLRLAAGRLSGPELRWQEAALAIAATPFIHRGVVALDLIHELGTTGFETAVECYRVPANGFFNYKAGQSAGVLYRG